MTTNTEDTPTSYRSRAVLVIVIVALIVLGVFLSVQRNIDRAEENKQWNTYTNETFEFSIQYPHGWEVVESKEDHIVPIITFYKPEASMEEEPPYDHFANATYVSVLPEGLGTEGLIGVTEETTVDLADDTSGTDYYLADGTVFATMANVRTAPETWEESGYIVGRARVKDLEVLCEQGGEPVSETLCDLPMAEGAERVWYGSIDEDERAAVENMLESFRFVE